MTVEVLANSPTPGTAAPLTTLNGGISGSQTTITVAAAAPAALRAGQFRIVIDSEIMLVTAGAETTLWTVTRAAENSSAATHTSGTQVFHVLTAGALDARYGSATFLLDGGTPTTQSGTVALDLDFGTISGSLGVFQFRRATAAEWATTEGKNTVLAAGEIGVETDTKRAKLGDGVKVYSTLPYVWGTTGAGISGVEAEEGFLKLLKHNPFAMEVTNEPTEVGQVIKSGAVGSHKAQWEKEAGGLTVGEIEQKFLKTGKKVVLEGELQQEFVLTALDSEHVAFREAKGGISETYLEQHAALVTGGLTVKGTNGFDTYIVGTSPGVAEFKDFVTDVLATAATRIKELLPVTASGEWARNRLIRIMSPGITLTQAASGETEAFFFARNLSTGTATLKGNFTPFWESTFSYIKGSIVAWSGSRWESKVEPNKANEPPPAWTSEREFATGAQTSAGNSIYESLVTPNKGKQPNVVVWKATKKYSKGELVTEGAVTYEAIVASTVEGTKPSASVGTEWREIWKTATNANWTKLTGTSETTVELRPGEAVLYESDRAGALHPLGAYRSLSLMREIIQEPTLAIQGTEADPLALILKNLAAPAWATSPTKYAKGAFVTEGGKLYESKIANNEGHQPSLDGGVNWLEVTPTIQEHQDETGKALWERQWDGAMVSLSSGRVYDVRLATDKNPRLRITGGNFPQIEFGLGSTNAPDAYIKRGARAGVVASTALRAEGITGNTGLVAGTFVGICTGAPPAGTTEYKIGDIAFDKSDGSYWLCFKEGVGAAAEWLNTVSRSVNAQAGKFLAQSFDIPTEQAKLTSGNVYLSKVMVPNTIEPTQLFYQVVTGVAGLTTAVLGVYSESGALLGKTVTQVAAMESAGAKSAAWEGGGKLKLSSGNKTGTFVWVTCLVVGASQPELGVAKVVGGRTQDLNVNLTASTLRCGEVGEEEGGSKTKPPSFTALPAQIVLTKNIGKNAAVPFLWAALA